MILRKIFSFVFYWCLCVTLSAQTSRIDSLELLLASAKDNHIKAELLLKLSAEYRYVDPEKGKTNAMEAIRLARNGSFAESRGYAALGDYYQITDQPYLAHVNYKKAEKLFIENKDQTNLLVIYYNLMHLFLAIEDKKNTTYYAERVQKMAEERNDQPKDIIAQFILGWARFEDDEGQDALDFYHDIYRKSLSLNDATTHFIASHCGSICLKLKHPREALQYLHRVRKHFEAGEMPVMPETYGFIAEAYAMLSMVDSADYYMKKAQQSYLVTDDTKLALLRCRSMLDSIRGDPWGALASFKLYHQLSDSIAKVGKMEEIGRMKNWYEIEQIDNKNQALQRDQEKQHKFILILMIALVMILSLFGFLVFFYRKTAEKNYELKKLHTVKDKLFSVVAHDLRSPMGALTSMLKLANRNMVDAETQAQLLKDISIRVDDTYNLLDNLLRWSKSQMSGIKPTPVCFDVQKGSLLVTDSLQGIAANKSIILDNRIGSQQVYADKDMFAVLVRNLTTNAIKYTSANGKVTLDSELSDQMLVISVKDTGTGMTQEIQNKLFNLSETKSRRGTNNESGTGLGLVLCADFVKANGGNIWFTSTQGEGSTFFFSIPVKA